jgi:acetyl esterase/lipase
MLTGLLILSIGIVTSSVFLAAIGVYLTLIYLLHFTSVTRSPSGEFEKAFGINWKTKIKSEQKKYFLSSRTVFKLPSVPEPRFEQNISFATIPGTDRELLCDIWQPNISIKPSGITLIYLHGSAFYFLDKDNGTRPFFKHLAAQGHVVMDVAYRLAPETGLMGMIHDVKRAIVWMKNNANKYEIDSGRIILGGGSSGGYLALMAAYSSSDPRFTSINLEEKDLNVCAVVAEYPATDLETLYYHTNQHLTTREVPGKPKKKVPTEMPSWLKKRIGKDFHRLGMDKGFENVGTIAPLMGGHPDECPERYNFFSPITHVNSNCPPTLLIHGGHDIMAPVKATRLLYNKLVKERVPTVMHILPQTDHAFDLLWPAIAPSAHNAFYDVERFIAVIANSKKVPTKLRLKNELVNT